MKTLTQITEELDAHKDELTELFRQQWEDEYQHKKDYNFLTIILVLLTTFTCGMNIWLGNRLSQAERNVEAMGKDLIEAKRTIKMNDEDLSQLICELKHDKQIDEGWVCQLWDDAD